MKEGVFAGLKKRLLQELVRISPGGYSLRPRMHRARGVQIGKDVWIGYDVVLETSWPHLITIHDGVFISLRVTVIAHFMEQRGVTIEKDAFIGPGALILPNVVIGQGAVVTAGSVVTQSVPPFTVVQGNPAVPIAKCGVPLKLKGGSLKDFTKRLRPLPRSGTTAKTSS